MFWRPVADSVCRCGAAYEAHVWLCNECGAQSTEYLCVECGNFVADRTKPCPDCKSPISDLPVASCECMFELNLFCPLEARIIDDTEWGEHKQVVRTYESWQRSRRRRGGVWLQSPGVFRVREAERLRGLSA